jgi:predicted NBD/HSP70 family sugar kinase
METSANQAIHRIIQLIWKEKEISRAELSRLSGFSRSTITANVDRLLQDDIVVETPLSGTDALQSKRKNLMLNRHRGIFIGIELDADSCAVGACDIMGTLLGGLDFPIDYIDGPATILKQICAGIKRLQETLSERSTAILGIGVGLPSPVDFAEGYAVHPAFMPGWHRYPVGRELNKKFSCPVYVDNEVNTMAFGEAFLSDQYRGSDLLFIKLGTGIGAGLIVQGSIYRGNSGMSGNIGHMRVDGDTTHCRCGKIGCLEAIAGKQALLDKAERLAQEHSIKILKQAIDENGALQMKDLMYALKHHDRRIIQMLEDSAVIIGRMIGSLVIFFDPKAVVLGGSLCEFGPPFIDTIRRTIINEATPWIKSDFDVNVTKFGDSIGTIGSAMLCISSLMQNGAFVNCQSELE